MNSPPPILPVVQAAWAEAYADKRVTWREFAWLCRVCAESAVAYMQQQKLLDGAAKLASGTTLALQTALWLAPGIGGKTVAFVVSLGPGWRIAMAIMEALVQAAYELQQLQLRQITLIADNERLAIDAAEGGGSA